MFSIWVTVAVAVCALFLMHLHQGDLWYQMIGEPSVRGKTVLVTGASMGIGAALGM